uniref:Uncharacterized protein n=1 Tax=Ananas comosus var. bracteatus TaxID=296719 RepID=A0A6V7QNP9_ANACO|nr:unnamed protein product [Ananas comosus var. bracteatus]
MARRYVFQGEEDEEDLFFDSMEDISSSSGSCPGSPEKQFSSSSSEECSVGYRVWMNNLDSVRERRDKFVRLMGMDLIMLPASPVLVLTASSCEMMKLCRILRG